MVNPKFNNEKFAVLMKSLCALYSRELTTDVVRMYWEDLNEFTWEQVDAMAKAHRRDPDRGRFFPKPADLLAKGPAHLNSDAAWAIAVKFLEEKIGVVWTREIQSATQAASGTWKLGDKIGARITFKGAYEAILCRLPHGSIPKWLLSAEGAPAANLRAIEMAKAFGYLSAPQAENILSSYVKTIGASAPEILTHQQPPENNVVAMISREERLSKHRENMLKLKSIVGQSAGGKATQEIAADKKPHSNGSGNMRALSDLVKSYVVATEPEDEKIAEVSIPIASGDSK